MWDTSTGDRLLSLTGHYGAVAAGCFMEGGQRAISCSVDGSLKVWDVTPHAAAGEAGLVRRAPDDQAQLQQPRGSPALSGSPDIDEMLLQTR